VQRAHAAGLQQLADDAVGLPERALEEDHAPALLAEGDGERAARDAGADYDPVGV
jgi:hypothetical protein